MQIIRKVFFQKINAPKRHKTETLPGRGGHRHSAVCIYVSFHLSQFSPSDIHDAQHRKEIHASNNGAKLNKITETKEKREHFFRASDEFHSDSARE